MSSIIFNEFITEIIQSYILDAELLVISDKKSNTILYIIDISGSTGNEFLNRTTIIAKLKEILGEFILKNKFGHNILLSFSDTYTRPKNYHGEILVDPDIELVQLPDTLQPGGLTYTDEPLHDVAKLIKEGIIPKPDLVRVLTDGDTNSRPEQLIAAVDALNKMAVPVSVTAVSTNTKNLNEISKVEGNKLVGMDLVDILQNQLKDYSIINRFHHSEPFLGAINSSISASNIMFCDIKLPTGISIHLFIWFVIDHLHPNINWGMNDFIRMCCEFGKLLSIFNVNLLDVNDNSDIANAIKEKTQHPVDITKIRKYITYGFNSARNKKSIILSAPEERVEIDSSTKQNQFADAVSDLKTKGTTLGCPMKISLSSKAIIIDDNTFELPNSLGPYRNSMTHDNQMAFFGFSDESSPGLEQALRIGLREYGKHLGFKDAVNSTSVIFYVANLMSLIMLKNEHLTFDDEFMIQLQRIAIAQCKQNQMIRAKTYGKSFYALWKEGSSPITHFTSKLTHMDCHTDRLINPLKLPPTIWWALMMSMLDCFDEQIRIYHLGLNSLGVEPTRDSFLNYMRRTYSHLITGNTVMIKFEPEKDSVITLRPFPSETEVLCVKSHLSPFGYVCNPKLWFSQDEIDKCGNKCMYCRTPLLQTDYSPIIRRNNIEKLHDILANPEKIEVTL